MCDLVRESDLLVSPVPLKALPSCVLSPAAMCASTWVCFAEKEQCWSFFWSFCHLIESNCSENSLHLYLCCRERLFLPTCLRSQLVLLRPLPQQMQRWRNFQIQHMLDINSAALLNWLMLFSWHFDNVGKAVSNGPNTLQFSGISKMDTSTWKYWVIFNWRDVISRWLVYEVPWMCAVLQRQAIWSEPVV